MEEERVAKLKEKELIKEKRTEQRMEEAAAKKRRAIYLEARKSFKQSWTTISIRQERMQRLVKSTCLQENTRPRFGIEALIIAKKNRVIAKARWEARM